MNIVSVIFLLIASTGLKSSDTCLIIQEKIITIDGNTSLGGFSCDYETSGKSDTLHIDNLSSSPYSFTIPVEGFRCGNFLLNKDFQTTLKAEEYPKVTVNVLSLKETEPGTLTGSVRLSLVGKSKTLTGVNFCIQSSGENKILTTNFIFHASEFNLTPPRRLGGLIKTDDAMNITVSLVLQPVDMAPYTAK